MIYGQLVWHHLSTGGQVIVISTPNGYDKIYYEIYDQSIQGMNDFVISELHWENDPRFTKDLVWIKTKDIIHYLLNREDYNDSLKLVEKDQDKFNDLKRKGYKPYSSWFEEMCKKLKFDRRKISQELESAFLGSGDNVIPIETIDNIKEKMIEEPKETYASGQLWVWEEAQLDHKYIMGIDVSRGDSEDFTSICVIDFEERKQVMEYLGKIPPDLAADLAFKWGNLYKAYIVIDITGGMGVATSRKLQELGYRDLYVEGANTADKWKYDPKLLEKIPGINFNNKRSQIVSSLEEGLRHGFIVKSHRLLNELYTFVFVNGRPNHMKGKHDDLIMAMAMALYVGENSFTQLKKADEMTRAMLDSWVKTEEDPKHVPVELRPNYNSDVLSPHIKPHTTQQQLYKEYSWLFGGKKR